MFELPTLPYKLNALEPYISARTMEFHYLKHHRAYVDTLNKLTAGTPYADMSVPEIMKQTVDKAELSGIFNQAAQVWNHTFFFNLMTPDGGGRPQGALAADIDDSFGSYEQFLADFKAAALAQFGSGWVWLVRGQNKKLEIVKTSNADNPEAHGQHALLTVDVWEHAYYLDYQNRRADFVDAVLAHLINWNAVK